MDLGSKSFTATHPSRRISFVLGTAIAGMFPVPKPSTSCQIWTNSQAPSKHYTSGSSGTPNPIGPNETYISPTLPSTPDCPWLLFLLLHTLSEQCHNSHHSRPGPSDLKVHVCVRVQSCPTLCDPNALSVEFSWQEYWSGLPFPSPGDSGVSCIGR